MGEQLRFVRLAFIKPEPSCSKPFCVLGPGFRRAFICAGLLVAMTSNPAVAQPAGAPPGSAVPVTWQQSQSARLVPPAEQKAEVLLRIEPGAWAGPQRQRERSVRPDAQNGGRERSAWTSLIEGPLTVMAA